MTQLEDDLDLEILRSINADVVADADALARVRTQIVTATPPRRAVTTWPKLAAVAVAALTVGVGVALMLPHFGTPAPAPSTTASAAPTLAQFSTQAAQASLLRTPLEPGPSQYRKVVARDLSSGGQTFTVAANGEDYRYRLRTTVITWVPGDPTRPWARTISTTLEPIDEAARRYQAKHRDTMGPTTGPVDHTSNGDFNVPASDGDWLNPSQAFLDQLPREPAQLLASARAWNTQHGFTNDAQTLLEALARPLSQTWIDDHDLRAALFTAIGQIEGVQLDDDATIGDQHGTALMGVSSRSGALRTEVLFDPNDYRLLAWRFVNDREGTVKTAETTFTSVIVSSAP